MVDITINERANHAQFVERFLNEIMWWKSYKTFENDMILYYHRNYLDRIEKTTL